MVGLTMLYHPTKAPEGRIFEDISNWDALVEDGWVDDPMKFGSFLAWHFPAGDANKKKLCEQAKARKAAFENNLVPAIESGPAMTDKDIERFAIRKQAMDEWESEIAARKRRLQEREEALEREWALRSDRKNASKIKNFDEVSSSRQEEVIENLRTDNVQDKVRDLEERAVAKRTIVDLAPKGSREESSQESQEPRNSSSGESNPELASDNSEVTVNPPVRKRGHPRKTP